MVRDYNFIRFRNIFKSKIDYKNEKLERPLFDNLDYIVGSDLLFNQTGLKAFENFLKNLIRLYKDADKKVPKIIFSHKGRNAEVDDHLVPIIEGLGFFGDQVEEKDMNDNWVNPRVDIFILELDDAEKNASEEAK